MLPLGMTMCDAPVESLITAQAAKELIKRSKNNTKNDHVYMKPLQMKFENLKLKDIKNLSVYAYVYKMPSGKGTNLQISLSTGMTSVTSNTLMGVKTTWDSISVNNPFLGIGTKDKSGNYKGKNTSDSPSKDKLIDFNLLYDPDLVFQNMMDISDKLSATSNSYIIDDTTSELSKQGGSNYFSNLWMTKDSDENRRFAFAFDLGAYLAANSLFPYLYKNPVTALQILDGTGTMQMQRPSQVLSMNVGRVFVDPFSLLPINQLGTSGYSTELGPDFDFPFKDVGAAHRIEKIAIPSIDSVMGTRVAKNSISFYEGKDHLDKIRQPNHYNKGTFRYSVEFSVYDASLVYLRTLLSNLVDQKTLLDNLYENITRSPYTELGNPDNTQASEGLNVVDFAQRKIDLVYNYYSPETGYLNGDPSKINVPLGMGSVFENKTIKEYLDSSLAFYEEVLNLSLIHI